MTMIIRCSSRKLSDAFFFFLTLAIVRYGCGEIKQTQLILC